MGTCFSFVYTMIIADDQWEYKRIKTEPPGDDKSTCSTTSSQDSDMSYISPSEYYYE